MIRKAFLMELKPGMIDEYEKAHNPIWPELHKVFNEHGGHNFSIFHDRKSNRLFGYLEIEAEDKFKEREKTEVCQKWFREMKRFLVSDSENDGKARTDNLREIFHID